MILRVWKGGRCGRHFVEVTPAPGHESRPAVRSTVSTIASVTFWHTQIGPHYDGDARGDSKSRCIGEVICPDCDNVMARLHERPDGISIHAWVPAPGQSPSDPGSQRVGWTLWAAIGDTTPADDEGSVLICWRGHGGLWVNGADCRAVIERYRVKGRKVRHPASRAPENAPS